jgi:hypothetical protein
MITRPTDRTAKQVHFAENIGEAEAVNPHDGKRALPRAGEILKSAAIRIEDRL